ncbi:MAG: hypothetical protein JWN46_2869 [Acidimicrobiales bacterium]|nr:hypothetical protein [Acidimicrobiales bacterium]
MWGTRGRAVASALVSMTVSESAAAVGALRRARRKHRVSDIHWVDAFYQVYITGIVAIVAIVLVSGVVGDQRLGAAGMARVHAHGPAMAGLAAALAVAVGLRSGGRGGPLALEAPDVRHVLLSPVDRGVALRGPALRQIRFLALCGAGAGAAAGQLALRRLGGNPAAWVASGAAFGLLCVGLGFGSALVASGRRLPRWAATAIGAVLLAWSVADATGRGPTAPASFAGRMALWPFKFDALAVVPGVLALALVAVGIASVAGTSLESAERRTSLVGQLKFAVTLQDLRTVLVLRRQLAMEVPRTRPWLRGSRRAPRFPVWRRGWRGVLRWPLVRVARVVVLAGGAGLALRGAYSGTTPLVVLAGLALWIAALDAVEPMAQETDHPGRRDGFPMDAGSLMVRHVPAPAVLMLLIGALAAGVAALPGGGSVPLAPAGVLAGTLGLLAFMGAAVSVLQGAPNQVDQLAMITPEVAGTRTVVRTVWPPALAVGGTLPIVAARAAASTHSATALSPAVAAAFVAIPLLIVVALGVAWVRYRDQLHAWIKVSMEQMSPTKAIERAQAERAALDDGDDEEEAR